LCVSFLLYACTVKSSTYQLTTLRILPLTVIMFKLLIYDFLYFVSHLTNCNKDLNEENNGLSFKNHELSTTAWIFYNLFVAHDPKIPKTKTITDLLKTLCRYEEMLTLMELM